MNDRSKHLERALEALNAQKLNKAEREFEKAIRELRSHSDPLDMFFALGQQGYMYEQMGEKEKAITAYSEAVDAATDIPATYHGLISLLVEKGDLDEAFRIADIWQEQGAQHIGRPAHDIFLGLGSSLIHNKDCTAAIDLLSRTGDFFEASSHSTEHWRARGLLGFAHEKSGNIAEAMEIFGKAVGEGSRDRQTFTRLIMFLEKDKQYEEALEVIEKGIHVQDDASWEADLKKRKQRISKKAGKISKEEARATIPQFTVRKGKDIVSLLYQVKCSPQITSLAVVKNRAYGLSGGKKPRVRVWDLETSEQVLEKELPETPSRLELTDIGFLTASEKGRIGEGSASIRFHDFEGIELGVQHLGDKLSDIAISANRIFVGCRDGDLYAFSSQGRKLWTVGLKQGKEDSDYMRPCPYYVRAGGDIVVFSSFNDLYAINDKGKLQWKWSTPTHTERSRTELIEFTFSSGPSSITGLAIADDGKLTFATAGNTIFQITDGKTKSKKKRKDKYLGSVFVRRDGRRFAVHEDGHFVLYEDSRSVGKILAPHGASLVYGPLILGWGGREFVIADDGGKDLARIEFVKNISSASFVSEDQIVVGAGHLIVLGIHKGRSATTLSAKHEVKPRTAGFSTTSRAEWSEESGIRVRWTLGNKISSGSGKAKYLARDGTELSIEQLALRHYSALGCEGFWSENEYWWAVMVLLFWDVVYAKIPGAYSDVFGDFPSQMQDMPRDLFSEEFYSRRKGLIETRLRSLGGDKPGGPFRGNISSEIRGAYRAHHGKPCRILDWDKYPDVKQLEFAGERLSTAHIAGIMIRLLRDFNNNRRGMPDLFLSCDRTPLFAEVKSEKESVKDEQIAWLRFLRDELGIRAEICRIRAA